MHFKCERSFPKNFPDEAKALVTGLLDPNPETRLGAGPRGLRELQVHVRVHVRSVRASRSIRTRRLTCCEPALGLGGASRDMPSLMAWTCHNCTRARRRSLRLARPRHKLMQPGHVARTPSCGHPCPRSTPPAPASTAFRLLKRPQQKPMPALELDCTLLLSSQRRRGDACERSRSR